MAFIFDKSNGHFGGNMNLKSKNKINQVDYIKFEFTYQQEQQKWQLRRALVLFIGCAFAAVLYSDPTLAVTVESLQEPIRSLKTEIFSGWMMVVKICAATAGIVLSAFRGSLAPFGIGAGLSAGIHLYDRYLGDGAAGALI